jgi:hypothetical protein
MDVNFNGFWSQVSETVKIYVHNQEFENDKRWMGAVGVYFRNDIFSGSWR